MRQFTRHVSLPTRGAKTDASAARSTTRFVMFVLCMLAAAPPVESAQIAAHSAVGNATATELVLLPQFCLAQYTKEFQGPPYEIPDELCGVGTNHYCEGLLDIIRANRSTKIDAKRAYLRKAKVNTEYTVGGIERWGTPKCPITEHVQKTLRQIQSLEGTLKGLK